MMEQRWKARQQTKSLDKTLTFNFIESSNQHFLWITEVLGSVVQSIVSLTDTFVVKMLATLVSAIPNSQIFCWKKMWVVSLNAKATHIFFSKSINVYANVNDQSVDDTLINDIVSFEQLGPDH